MKPFFVLSFLIFLTCDAKVFDYQPEQVHISFGEKVNEIVITWSTFDDCGSIVEYWPSNSVEESSRLQSIGNSSIFIDGGDKKHSQFIHKVTLPPLKADQRYNYIVGSDLGWSPIFNFVVKRQDADWSPSVVIFGDMGNENAQSMAYLQKEAEEDKYDAILHVGDFAYDMDTDDALVGDQFMRQIQEIAAYVPYMVCVGNHEEKYNFSNYRRRFSMPGGSDSLFYSFDLGPVHFISISTEVYYFLNYGIKPLVLQYQWLEEDLKKASENRAERPWIIVMGHRPMYCSNHNEGDCNDHETLTRVGLPFTKFFGMEDLFFAHGVDVLIWAHEHSYERLWPIYNYKVLNGSSEEPYKNPGAPIHIITGSAGCKEEKTPFIGERPEWSAFHSTDYGYTKLKAHNKTHLYFEQISVDKKGEVIDSYWIIKDKHQSFLLD